MVVVVVVVVVLVVGVSGGGGGGVQWLDGVVGSGCVDGRVLVCMFDSDSSIIVVG